MFEKVNRQAVPMNERGSNLLRTIQWTLPQRGNCVKLYFKTPIQVLSYHPSIYNYKLPNAKRWFLTCLEFRISWCVTNILKNRMTAKFFSNYSLQPSTSDFPELFLNGRKQSFVLNLAPVPNTQSPLSRKFAGECLPPHLIIQLYNLTFLIYLFILFLFWVCYM